MRRKGEYFRLGRSWMLFPGPKNPRRSFLFKAFVTVFLALFLIGCSLIAPYDRAAYEHATSVKAEALLLMDRANTPYSGNTERINAVILDLNKAYEYDKGRAKNTITVRLWRKLLDPEGHLFGGFIRYWKSRGELHPAYIEEKKQDIEDAFDQIIQLEQGKGKGGDKLVELQIWQFSTPMVSCRKC